MKQNSGSINTSILFGASLLALVVWIARRIRARSQLPLPPGPKGLPIVGNIHDLPPPGVPEWQHWTKHKDLYGPISSVTALGTTIVLINDQDIAVELLAKRSAKFSDRPQMFFAQHMCGFDSLPAFQGNNEMFRAQRRLMGAQLGSKSSMTKFFPALEFQVRHFLQRLLDRPAELTGHLQMTTGALMLDTLYGYTSSLAAGPDPLITLVNRFMADFSVAAVPGRWLADMVPLLRHVPDWMPGTGFKAIAREYKQTFDDVKNTPYLYAERKFEQGSAKPSFIRGLLQDRPTAKEREVIKSAGIGLYSGGTDTTVAALSFFFLAMTVFPDVQKKAKEEIDRVTGGTRLPSFQDRESLPYVDAVVKEALRWSCIAPLCLPHATDEDDEFQGYRIPKGSIIVPVIRRFAFDKDVYERPDDFEPQRFLGPKSVPNPWDYVFGYGRRICPGRYLADASLFLIIAQSLAAFDIGRAVDPDTGAFIDPEVKSMPGVVMYPQPYKNSIVPRSKAHVEMVRNMDIEYDWDEQDGKPGR
ncbi:uncharacterized protein JN550_001416 [Neoarthrinium moseri]|uniref:uncharacterized protein n=1 Tax=Neoarthrinium moseri TaxID=1658444 RepID=UPI001FDDD59A|nr:uncharacterized protein JN550_001416 [Neoarthrinium moseri]KAI1875920.1 hypothetical protein JN550_001416 [Neoarthrinium moseri]